MISISLPVVKRAVVAAAAAVMLASVLAASSGAQATQIPAEVQVTDPVDDANYLNDQDNAYDTPAQGEGDHAGPADVGSATDFMAIWFSHTAETVSLHFQTQAAPLNMVTDTYWRFASNPGTGPKGADEVRGCLFYVLVINSGGNSGGNAGAWTGPDTTYVEDSCNVGADQFVEGTFTVEELADGSGITTLTYPRSFSPLFADGSKLIGIFGVARTMSIGPGSPGPGAYLTSDTTQRGTDYTITPVGGPPSGGKPGCPQPKPKPKPTGSASPAPTAAPSPSPSATSDDDSYRAYDDQDKGKKKGKNKGKNKGKKCRTNQPPKGSPSPSAPPTSTPQPTATATGRP
ncbi:MAG TPA: hypothetical protein VNC78_11240 [Actinomycetota bacterium]|nr:hypothetical protein [Actinomycetota bacterium]